MPELKHIVGDATEPGQYPAIIAHVCNDKGYFASGFVVPLGRKYPKAKQEYLKMTRRDLGTTGLVIIDDRLIIANMIAQHDIYAKNGIPPIRYQALQRCLETVYKYAENIFTVHMPRIGANRSGGDWTTIERIIRSAMSVDTFVYTLPSEVNRFIQTS